MKASSHFDDDLTFGGMGDNVILIGDAFGTNGMKTNGIFQNTKNRDIYQKMFFHFMKLFVRILGGFFLNVDRSHSFHNSHTFQIHLIFDEIIRY